MTPEQLSQFDGYLCDNCKGTMQEPDEVEFLEEVVFDEDDNFYERHSPEGDITGWVCKGCYEVERSGER